MENMLQEIKKAFKNTQVIYLATCGSMQPKVRPVTLVKAEDSFWVATSASDAKVRQVKDNPKIEFCMPIQKEEGFGYVRAECMSELIESMDIKKEITAHIPFFKDFWKSVEDPDFALIKLNPGLLEYIRPGEFKAHKLNSDS